ncbi:hypothetical protein AVEN_125137-1 [Araneus ventricosus]|uniref:Uncharacterized protein n=1 Tax=Araneus ventricosus TaxID=182803 RepID=A0A4Y2RTU3_ARAVE|nr:hypothetical protein AVEN_125137-1 [Araneus ventricosus]
MTPSLFANRKPCNRWPFLKHLHHSNVRICLEIFLLLLESGVNLDEFDHHAFFHPLWHLLLCHLSSNCQKGLSRFKPVNEGEWLVVFSLFQGCTGPWL